MASRKDEKKDTAASPVKSESGSEPSRHLEEIGREQSNAISRSFDESKENIRRSLNEAEQEIPRYTQVAKDYQTKSINVSRDVAESYFDSQKSAINSMQSTWNQNVRQMESWWGFPMSPEAAAEQYSRMATSFADAAIVASKAANRTIFANLEAASLSLDQFRESAREMARVYADTVSNVARTSRELTDRSSRMREQV